MHDCNPPYIGIGPRTLSRPLISAGRGAFCGCTRTWACACTPSTAPSSLSPSPPRPPPPPGHLPPTRRPYRRPPRPAPPRPLTPPSPAIPAPPALPPPPLPVPPHPLRPLRRLLRSRPAGKKKRRPGRRGRGPREESRRAGGPARRFINYANLDTRYVTRYVTRSVVDKIGGMRKKRAVQH
jgi:hypothetical protein